MGQQSKSHFLTEVSVTLQKTDDGIICKYQGVPIWIEPDGKLVVDFKDPFRAVEFCQYLMKNHGIAILPEFKKESNFNGK